MTEAARHYDVDHSTVYRWRLEFVWWGRAKKNLRAPAGRVFNKSTATETSSDMIVEWL